MSNCKCTCPPGCKCSTSANNGITEEQHQSLIDITEYRMMLMQAYTIIKGHTSQEVQDNSRKLLNSIENDPIMMAAFNLIKGIQ